MTSIQSSYSVLKKSLPEGRFEALVTQVKKQCPNQGLNARIYDLIVLGKKAFDQKYQQVSEQLKGKPIYKKFLVAFLVENTVARGFQSTGTGGKLFTADFRGMNEEMSKTCVCGECDTPYKMSPEQAVKKDERLGQILQQNLKGLTSDAHLRVYRRKCENSISWKKAINYAHTSLDPKERSFLVKQLKSSYQSTNKEFTQEILKKLSKEDGVSLNFL